MSCVMYGYRYLCPCTLPVSYLGNRWRYNKTDVEFVIYGSELYIDHIWFMGVVIHPRPDMTHHIRVYGSLQSLTLIDLDLSDWKFLGGLHSHFLHATTRLFNSCGVTTRFSTHTFYDHNRSEFQVSDLFTGLSY